MVVAFDEEEEESRDTVLGRLVFTGDSCVSLSVITMSLVQRLFLARVVEV